ISIRFLFQPRAGSQIRPLTLQAGCVPKGTVVVFQGVATLQENIGTPNCVKMTTFLLLWLTVAQLSDPLSRGRDALIAVGSGLKRGLARSGVASPVGRTGVGRQRPRSYGENASGKSPAGKPIVRQKRSLAESVRGLSAQFWRFLPPHQF